MKSILKGQSVRVLIVEDEIIPANYLKKVLISEGYDVLPIVDTGKEALKVSKIEKPNIILMDVMLKDHISGCDVAFELSQYNPQILIIFLTAYSDKEMVDFAVESKAFGYLLKPYRDKEILATLALSKAQLAMSPLSLSPLKTKVTKDHNRLALTDGYYYNFDTHTLFNDKEKEMPCGPKALELIALLCQHHNSTVTLETIMEVLWGKPIMLQTLRSLIHRIRKNISPNLIINVNKLGYKIGLKE